MVSIEKDGMWRQERQSVGSKGIEVGKNAMYSDQQAVLLPGVLSTVRHGVERAVCGGT